MRPYYKLVHLYARFLSSASPTIINNSNFEILRKHEICLQKNNLPPSNLIVSAQIHCSHLEFFNGNKLRVQMTKHLNRFKDFQLRICNIFCPSTRVQIRTCLWIVKMDKERQKEKFSKLCPCFI